MISGATLRECADMLFVGGAAEVVTSVGEHTGLNMILPIVEGHSVKRVYSLNGGVDDKKTNQARAGKGIPSSTSQNHWPWPNNLGLQ